MQENFFYNTHPSNAQWNSGQCQSWKALCSIKEDVDNNMFWSIGVGEVSFWYDNWSNLGPLYLLLQDTNTQNQIRVNEVLINGKWDWSRLQVQPDEETKMRIKDLNIKLCRNRVDKAIWMPSNTGRFTVSSAWETFRQRKELNRFISGVWYKEVPFKINFLTWRAIQDKLSTKDRVARFGIEMEPKCHCCNNNNQNPITENVDHLFCLGEHAKKIWRFFAGPLGIDYNNMNLKMLLLKWWNFKILSNSFGRAILGEDWQIICVACEAMIEQRISKIVKWNKPPLQVVKLNSDGSCNQGMCGGGGLVRNN
nr:uncharacterized protein LOC117278552 [Nicotiana tomentosiformis]